MSKKNILVNRERIQKDEWQIVQDFNKGESYGSEQFRVEINHKQVYARKIDVRSLVRMGLCPHLREKHIIELPATDFSTNLSSWKHIVDKMFMFLCTGYLNIPSEEWMNMLYLSIHLEIKQLTKELLVNVPRSENNHLWEVLLRVFNDPTKRRDVEDMKTLMGKNPRFLVDATNQQEISRPFLKLKSLVEVQRFLEALIEVLTDQGKFQVTMKYRSLIDTLLKYYIYKNKMPPTQYSLSRVNKLLGNNIADEARVFEDGDVQGLISQIKSKERKVRDLEEEYNRDKLTIEEEISDIERKLESYRRRPAKPSYKADNQRANISWEPPRPPVQPKMEVEDDYIPPPPVNTERLRERSPQPIRPPAVRHFKGEIVYHHQMLRCNQTEGLMLACGHINCRDCSVMWAFSLLDSYNKNKDGGKL